MNDSFLSNNSDASDSCNASSGSLNECLWRIPHSEPVAGLVATFYLFIFFTAFFWNLLVIVIFLKERMLIREPSSMFLLALAVVDFLDAVLSVPFYVAALIGGGWIFGDTDEVRQDVCTAVGFVFTLFLLMTVHILALIAFDRFVYIVFAVRYEKWMTPKTTLLMTLVVAIVPVILSAAPLFGFGSLGFSDVLGVCVFRWAGYREYVITVGIEAMIPIVATIVFTLWTYIYVKRFLSRRHENRSYFSTSASREQLNTEKRQTDRALARTFTLLLVSQVICFTPGLLTAFIGFFVGYDNVPPSILLIDFVIITASVAVNPVIQTLTKRKIRAHFFRLLNMMSCGYLCARAVQEETSDSSGHKTDLRTDRSTPALASSQILYVDNRIQPHLNNGNPAVADSTTSHNTTTNLAEGTAEYTLYTDSVSPSQTSQNVTLDPVGGTLV